MQFTYILAALASLALSNAAALPEPEAFPSPEAVADLVARGVASANEINSAKIALQKHCGGPSYPYYQTCGCAYAAGAGLSLNVLGILGLNLGAVSGGIGPCY